MSINIHPLMILTIANSVDAPIGRAPSVVKGKTNVHSGQKRLPNRKNPPKAEFSDFKSHPTLNKHVIYFQTNPDPELKLIVSAHSPDYQWF